MRKLRIPKSSIQVGLHLALAAAAVVNAWLTGGQALAQGGTGEIRGRKYLATQGTNPEQAPGLPGWTIYLDANDNEVLDPGETSTLTGADGSYSFPALAPADYVVRELEQAGWQMVDPPPLVAMMSGDQEVPPVAVMAGGQGNFSLDPATLVLTFVVGAGGLTGPITAAHIHPGAPGVEGPPLYDLLAAATMVSPDGMSFSGALTMAPADIPDLDAGLLYVNLHTDANPDGEVRGQILPTNGAWRITLHPDEVRDRLFFGNRELNVISGWVAIDSPAGTPDPPVGLPGWTVYLDLNHNEVLDSGEPSMVSDSAGNFRFSGLTPGDYWVREIEEPGWHQEGPAPYTAWMYGAPVVPATMSLALGVGEFRPREQAGPVPFGVSYHGLGSPPTEVHIHQGEPGVNGPAIHDLVAAAGSPDPLPDQIFGEVTFSQGDIDDLLAGRLYVDVHSSGFPNGEIRGPIEFTNGAYHVQLTGESPIEGLSLRNLEEQTIAVISVPTLSAWGLIALAIGLGLTATWWLRRRVSA